MTENLQNNYEQQIKQLKAEIQQLKSQKLVDHKYKLIFENSHNPVFIINKNQVIDCNTSSVKLFKANEIEQLAGLSVYELFPKTDENGNDLDKYIKKNIKKAFKNQSHVFETVILDFENNIIPVEISCTAIPYRDITMLFSVFRDITSVRYAERQVLLNRQKYEAVFHAANEAIFIHDYESGKILEVNDGFSALFGFEKNEVKDLTVNMLSEAKAPYDQEHAMKNIRETLNKGPQLFEWRSKTKSGRTFWSEVSLKAVEIDNKTRVVAVVRDIDDRKNLEILHINEKEFLRVIFDSSPAFHVAINSEGKTVMMNKSMLKALGYKEKDVIGKDYLQKLVPEEEHTNLDNIFQTLTKRRKPTFSQNHILTKKGKKLLVEWQGRPLLDYKGDLEMFIGMGIEITEKKLAERRIKESEEQYRVLFETAGDSIFLMDNRIFIDCNQKTLEIFDCTRDQIIGKPPYEFSPEFQPDGQKSLKKAIQKINAARNGEPQLFEWKHKKYSGELFDAEVSLNQVKLSTKDYILAIVRDISERKSVDNKIKKLNQELGERAKELEKEIKQKTKHQIDLQYQNEQIAKLNQELVFALERSEQSDRLKSAFLANMSHEVRTPLNAVLGFSELLDEEELDKSKRDYYLSIIKSSGNQLLTLINDIIDISKIEAGILQLAKSKLNINRLIDEIELQANAIKEKYEKDHLLIATEKGLDDDNAKVNLDEVRFRQIMLNLIENAIKFTKTGSVTFGYRLKNNYLEFFVRDTGIGVPIDQQKYIFERFRQVELTPKRKFGGTGLGLSIAKALVEMFKGEIWLNSKEGSGTTFYFTLPYKDETKKPEEKKFIEELPEYNWNKKKLLIVEDEEVNYMFIHEVLKRTGIEVYHAKDGIEAVEFVKNNTDLSIILMDIRLPNMDGFTAIKKIHKINNKIPVIAQTAYASDEDKKKCFEKGCIDYLAKPVKTNVLLTTISKYL